MWEEFLRRLVEGRGRHEETEAGSRAEVVARPSTKGGMLVAVLGFSSRTHVLS